MTVTRAAMKYSVILDMLRAQQATLTSVAMIAPHLTQENYADLLRRIAGASTRDVERLVAGFSPTKAKRDIIRPISVSVPETPLSAESKFINGDVDAAQQENSTELGEALVLSGTSEKAANKVRIAFDAPAELAEKIERLKEIHAHKLKDGSLAEVLAMAVDMLLEKTAPEHKADTKLRCVEKKSAHKDIPKTTSPTLNVGVRKRRPPAAVQREVWKRDAGQCTFQNEKGRRCSARGRLQIDHIQPWALGGSSRDVGNLRLLCQAHNLLVAERYFPAKR